MNYINTKEILILFVILLSIPITTFAINQTLNSEIYFNPNVSFKYQKRKQRKIYEKN